MKKLKIMIEGLGNWGSSFLYLTQSSDVKDKFQVVGIVSRDPVKANQKQNQFNTRVPVYSNWAEGINAAPDAVYVATPDFHHLDNLDSLVDAFEKKNTRLPHILVEKPLHYDINRCIASLVRLGYSHRSYGKMETLQGPFIMVDWHKKFSSQQRYIDQMIEQGQLQNLTAIRVSYQNQRKVFDGEYLTWAEKTDLFSFLSGHFFDVIFNSFNQSYPVTLTSNAYFDNKRIMREANIDFGLYVPSQNQVVPVHMRVTCNEPNTSPALTEQDLTYVFANQKIKIDTTGKDVEILTDKLNYVNTHGRVMLKDRWEGTIQASGYTFDSQKRWINTCYDLIHNKLQVADALSKYPLNLLPEFCISSCKISLDNGEVYANYQTGKPLNLRSETLDIIL